MRRRGWRYRPRTASLTFSPACLMLPLAWSRLPLRSRRRFPVAAPAAALTLPFIRWVVCFAFSAAIWFSDRVIRLAEVLAALGRAFDGAGASVPGGGREPRADERGDK